MACSNYSLRSVDHIGDLFRTTFPDSKIASKFTLSRTSASYMIGEGISPHFTSLMVKTEVFWNRVFHILAENGELQYKVLPSVIKSALVLAQINAESDRSLSMNARIVTQERASLGEKNNCWVTCAERCCEVL